MKKIIIEVNHNLELMNGLLMMSKYNQITKPYIGYGLMTEEENAYTTALKEFLTLYRNHKIFPLIESMIPKGFTFSRPVELMLATKGDNDFSLKYELSDLCIQYCGGKDNIDHLLEQLHDFADKIQWKNFYPKIDQYYSSYIVGVRKHTENYSIIELMEQEFGEDRNSYHYVIDRLMLGNYGIEFLYEGKKHIYSVIYNAVAIGDDDSLKQAHSVGVLFHEFAHSFINPLTDKYGTTVNQYIEAYEWLKNYKANAYNSGYGDWKECVNEHFVRAMSIHMMRKCKLNDGADQVLKHDIAIGYRYLQRILDKYAYYDDNRENYRNFEDFYVELLSVFCFKIECASLGETYDIVVENMDRQANGLNDKGTLDVGE